MHVSDGVLPPAVWLGGLAAAAAAVGVSLSRFEERAVPRLAVLTSLFFVASLIHVPLGFTSVHLMLNGLLGIVLGALSFPAALVALFFQCVFLGHGGLTTIGVNTITMGSGALAARAVFTACRRAGGGPRWVALSAFAATLAAVAVSGALFFAAMALAGESMARVAALTLLPQAVVAVIDGAVTASTVAFLAKVKPEMLPGNAREPRPGGEAGPPRAPSSPSEARNGKLGAPLRAIAALAGLACALAPAGVLAHALRATAVSDGGSIVIQVVYSDDTPAVSARVSVAPRDAGASPVARGTTGPDGRFRFVFQGSTDLVASIDDGAGHHVDFVIPAALLRAPGSPGPSGAAPAARSDGPLLEWIGGTWARVAAGIAAIVFFFGVSWLILRARRHGPP